MKVILISCIICLFILKPALAQTDRYLEELKKELEKKWPHNRAINLVFHGHSVPAGYFRTPEVRTFGSYPFLVLMKLKTIYPNAVVNAIITSKGGENSSQGKRRYRHEVLNHKPDVLFIDYALNDRSIGLKKSKKNLEKMIRIALRKKIKVILLTPSADETVDLLKPGNELDLFAKQIQQISLKYKVGLVNSLEQFKRVLERGKSLKNFMAQSNHPNKEGHELIADEIMHFFKSERWTSEKLEVKSER